MFDSKMHGGKYRQRPFYDHFTNRNILPDSFKVRSVQDKINTTNVEILNGSKWTVIFE